MISAFRAHDSDAYFWGLFEKKIVYVEKKGAKK